MGSQGTGAGGVVEFDFWHDGGEEDVRIEERLCVPDFKHLLLGINGAGAL